jgi:hypothetical protein
LLENSLMESYLFFVAKKSSASGWYTIDVATYFFGHLHTVSLTNSILVNLPHTLIFITAYWIAMNVDKTAATAPA